MYVISVRSYHCIELKLEAYFESSFLIWAPLFHLFIALSFLALCWHTK